MTTQTKATKEYCPGHLANGNPCPNIIYVWDEKRQSPRVMYRNKNLLWLPPGVSVDIRCGRCGTELRVEYDDPPPPIQNGG